MFSVYNYLFERKNIVSPEGKIYKPDDKVSYRSKSRNVIYQDAVIGRCYDTGLYVKYGFDEKFFYGALGTEKWISLDKIDKLIGKREKKVKA